MLSFDNSIHVSTVDYNPPRLVNKKNKNLEIYANITSRYDIVTMDELRSKNLKYDIIFSYSSIEHDGLGRYGDPINPKGDIVAMFEFYHMLSYATNKDGYLFLGIPVTQNDHLVSNSHRLYGPCRLNKILFQYNLWKVLDVFGSNENEKYMTIEDAILNKRIFVGNRDAWEHQPIFAMKKNVIWCQQMHFIQQMLNTTRIELKSLDLK